MAGKREQMDPAGWRGLRISSLTVLLMTGLLAFGTLSGRSLVGPLGWKDADGNPLPFQSPEEIEDFLLTAEVLQVKRAPEGTTAPQKVLLMKDGIRIHAIFRHVRVNQPQIRLASGAVKFNFRDDAIFEVAAYRLARLLGYQNIPPTVCREIRGREGTLQAWVSGCMTEGQRVKQKKQAVSAWRWAMEIQAMQLFDALIFNEDRNLGNVLIDADWNIWMIDHTRSFRIYDEPANLEQVKSVERGVWKRLSKVSDEVFVSELSEFLSEGQIRTLLKRRAVIVAHLQKLMEERGQSQVLYTLWPEREEPTNLALVDSTM